MTRDPRVRLADILASIDHILEYTAGLSYEAFESDPLVQDAVLAAARDHRRGREGPPGGRA